MSATVFPVAFKAMLLRAFSRSESRYSCVTSSFSSSELSSSDSDSEEEEECDEDGLEDVDDGEEELKNPAHSADFWGSNLPFPFCCAESVILDFK